MLLFAPAAQGLDSASERVARALPAQLERQRQQVAMQAGRMQRIGAIHNDRFSYELAASAARLEDLSPVKTLARGYSITRDAHGAILRSAASSKPGDRVQVTLSDGRLECEVLEAGSVSGE